MLHYEGTHTQLHTHMQTRICAHAYWKLCLRQYKIFPSVRELHREDRVLVTYNMNHYEWDEFYKDRIKLFRFKNYGVHQI